MHMKIAEVSKKFDLSQDTLRYYERIGLIPRVGRNSSGIRDYKEKDLGWVEFIKCMRNAGLSIESLIEYVKLFEEGEHTAGARKDILFEEREKLRERIAQMKETLKRLDKKIKGYERCLNKEKELR